MAPNSHMEVYMKGGLSDCFISQCGGKQDAFKIKCYWLWHKERGGQEKHNKSFNLKTKLNERQHGDQHERNIKALKMKSKMKSEWKQDALRDFWAGSLALRWNDRIFFQATTQIINRMSTYIQTKPAGRTVVHK